MCKVLIVDDDPDFVEIARIILEKGGHEVRMAFDGDQSLDNLKQEVPAVVLLDIMMKSVLEGVHVSRQIHADPALKKTHVIMVTSIMDTEQAALFPTDEYLPAEGWLTKPVQPQVLLETVNKFGGSGVTV